MMRKVPVLLLGCLLLSTSTTFAQARSEASPGKKAPDELGLAKVTQDAPGQRAFFVLEGEWGEATPREMAFEIRFGERVMLRDVLQLPKDAVGGTFELLAGDPEALGRLLARAEKQGHRARVTVSVDGRPLRSFSIPELLAYNRQFQESPPNVRQVLGEVRTFAPGALKPSSRDFVSLLAKDYDPVCLSNCDTNRDWCYQTEPACEGVDWCEVCEDEWTLCSNGCWICTDPKSVTERTRTWLKNAYWWGSRCLEDVWQELYYYDLYDLVFQNDRIRRTEYCDGSVVETVLYSWDTYGDCIRSTPWTCSFYQGSAFGSYCPF